MHFSNLASMAVPVPTPATTATASSSSSSAFAMPANRTEDWPLSCYQRQPASSTFLRLKYTLLMKIISLFLSLSLGSICTLH